MKTEHSSVVLDIALVLVSGALLVAVCLGITERRGVTAKAVRQPRILVDAGHGGPDGGASAADGTLEKDINLAIALPLGDILQVMGFEVTQTRTEDVMISTTGNTLHERKVSDMKNRLALIEQADMAVSIHQNTFSQQKYH
jgi:N-acetylmuramoyl-L-alanine amidase